MVEMVWTIRNNDGIVVRNVGEILIAGNRLKNKWIEVIGSWYERRKYD